MVGDPIRGTFEIDLSKADRRPESADLLYYVSEIGNDFIKGYFPPSEEHFDSMYFYNGLDPNFGTTGPFVDSFFISDYSRKYGELNTFIESALYIASPNDWLNGTEFAEFEFLESDLSGLPFNDSFGGIFSHDIWDAYYTETRFKLSHVKLYAVNVPEPSSASLMLFASGVIFLRRKFKHCLRRN
jgi:hypothetical protein